MNRIVDEFRQDDERVLDQLVDGELSDADRKALLSALDEEPGAWRRCALAFLESQMWRGDFRTCRNEPVAREVKAETVRAEQFPKPSRFFEICLAIAASVVVAFGIGIWIRGEWQGSGSPAQFVDHSTRRNLVPPTVVDQKSPWHHAKLNFNEAGKGNSSQLEVPIVEAPAVTPDWLQKHSSALPADVEQALQAAGHRVTKHRALIPVRSEDGRLLLMPVEQVDVEPESRPAY